MYLPDAIDSKYSKFKKQTKLKHSTGMFQRKEPIFPFPCSLPPLNSPTIIFVFSRILYLSRFSPEMKPNTWFRTENWLVRVCLRRPITCTGRLEAQESWGVSLHLKAWIPGEWAHKSLSKVRSGEGSPSLFLQWVAQCSHTTGRKPALLIQGPISQGQILRDLPEAAF